MVGFLSLFLVLAHDVDPPLLLLKALTLKMVIVHHTCLIPKFNHVLMVNKYLRTQMSLTNPHYHPRVLVQHMVRRLRSICGTLALPLGQRVVTVPVHPPPHPSDGERLPQDAIFMNKRPSATHEHNHQDASRTSLLHISKYGI